MPPRRRPGSASSSGTSRFEDEVEQVITKHKVGYRGKEWADIISHCPDEVKDAFRRCTAEALRTSEENVFDIFFRATDSMVAYCSVRHGKNRSKDEVKHAIATCPYADLWSIYFEECWKVPHRDKFAEDEDEEEAAEDTASDRSSFRSRRFRYNFHGPFWERLLAARREQLLDALRVDVSTCLTIPPAYVDEISLSMVDGHLRAVVFIQEGSSLRQRDVRRALQLYKYPEMWAIYDANKFAPPAPLPAPATTTGAASPTAATAAPGATQASPLLGAAADTNNTAGPSSPLIGSAKFASPASPVSHTTLPTSGPAAFEGQGRTAPKTPEEVAADAASSGAGGGAPSASPERGEDESEDDKAEVAELNNSMHSVEEGTSYVVVSSHRVRFHGKEWYQVLQANPTALLNAYVHDVTKALCIRRERIFGVSFATGSLVSDVVIEHSSSLTNREIDNTLMAYHYPRTWDLYHQIVNADFWNDFESIATCSLSANPQLRRLEWVRHGVSLQLIPEKVKMKRYIRAPVARTKFGLLNWQPKQKFWSASNRAKRGQKMPMAVGPNGELVPMDVAMGPNGKLVPVGGDGSASSRGGMIVGGGGGPPFLMEDLLIEEEDEEDGAPSASGQFNAEEEKSASPQRRTVGFGDNVPTKKVPRHIARLPGAADALRAAPDDDDDADDGENHMEHSYMSNCDSDADDDGSNRVDAGLVPDQYNFPLQYSPDLNMAQHRLHFMADKWPLVYNRMPTKLRRAIAEDILDATNFPVRSLEYLRLSLQFDRITATVRIRTVVPGKKVHAMLKRSDYPKTWELYNQVTDGVDYALGSARGVVKVDQDVVTRHRIRLEGRDWDLVLRDSILALNIAMRVDIGAACSVPPRNIQRVKFCLGSLVADFDVQHHPAVKMESCLRACDFENTWALYRPRQTAPKVGLPMPKGHDTHDSDADDMDYVLEHNEAEESFPSFSGGDTDDDERAPGDDEDEQLPFEVPPARTTGFPTSVQHNASSRVVPKPVTEAGGGDNTTDAPPTQGGNRLSANRPRPLTQLAEEHGVAASPPVHPPSAAPSVSSRVAIPGALPIGPSTSRRVPKLMPVLRRPPSPLPPRLCGSERTISPISPREWVDDESWPSMYHTESDEEPLSREGTPELPELHYEEEPIFREGTPDPNSDDEEAEDPREEGEEGEESQTHSSDDDDDGDGYLGLPQLYAGDHADPRLYAADHNAPRLHASDRRDPRLHAADSAAPHSLYSGEDDASTDESDSSDGDDDDDDVGNEDHGAGSVPQDAASNQVDPDSPAARSAGGSAGQPSSQGGVSPTSAQGLPTGATPAAGASSKTTPTSKKKKKSKTKKEKKKRDGHERKRRGTKKPKEPKERQPRLYKGTPVLLIKSPPGMLAKMGRKDRDAFGAIMPRDQLLDYINPDESWPSTLSAALVSLFRSATPQEPLAQHLSASLTSLGDRHREGSAQRLIASDGAHPTSADGLPLVSSSAGYPLTAGSAVHPLTASALGRALTDSAAAEEGEPKETAEQQAEREQLKEHLAELPPQEARALVQEIEQKKLEARQEEERERLLANFSSSPQKADGQPLTAKDEAAALKQLLAEQQEEQQKLKEQISAAPLQSLVENLTQAPPLPVLRAESVQDARAICPINADESWPSILSDMIVAMLTAHSEEGPHALLSPHSGGTPLQLRANEQEDARHAQLLASDQAEARLLASDQDEARHPALQASDQADARHPQLLATDKSDARPTQLLASDQAEARLRASDQSDARYPQLLASDGESVRRGTSPSLSQQRQRDAISQFGQMGLRVRVDEVPLGDRVRGQEVGRWRTPELSSALSEDAGPWAFNWRQPVDESWPPTLSDIVVSVFRDETPDRPVLHIVYRRSVSMSGVSLSYYDGSYSDLDPEDVIESIYPARRESWPSIGDSVLQQLFRVGTPVEPTEVMMLSKTASSLRSLVREGTPQIPLSVLYAAGTPQHPLPYLHEVGTPQHPLPVLREVGTPQYALPYLFEEGTPMLPVGTLRAEGTPQLPLPILHAVGTPQYPLPVLREAGTPQPPLSVLRATGTPQEEIPYLMADGTPMLPVDLEVLRAEGTPQLPIPHLFAVGDVQLPRRGPLAMRESESMPSASVAPETPLQKLDREGTPECRIPQLRSVGTPQLPTRTAQDLARRLTSEELSVQSISEYAETPLRMLAREGTPEALIPPLREVGTPQLPTASDGRLLGYGMHGTQGRASESVLSCSHMSAAGEEQVLPLLREGTPDGAIPYLREAGTPQLPHHRRPISLQLHHISESMPSMGDPSFTESALQTLIRDGTPFDALPYLHAVGTPELPYLRTKLSFLREVESLASVSGGLVARSRSTLGSLHRDGTPEDAIPFLHAVGTPEPPTLHAAGLADRDSMASASAIEKSRVESMQREGTPCEAIPYLREEGTPEPPFHGAGELMDRDSMASASAIEKSRVASIYREGTPDEAVPYLREEGTPEPPTQRADGLVAKDSMASASVFEQTLVSSLFREGTPSVAIPHLTASGTPVPSFKLPEALLYDESMPATSTVNETPLTTLEREGTAEIPVPPLMVDGTPRLPVHLLKAYLGDESMPSMSARSQATTAVSLHATGTPELPTHSATHLQDQESLTSASAVDPSAAEGDVGIVRDGTPQLPAGHPSMVAAESVQSASVAGFGAESHEELNRDGTPQLAVRHPESMAAAESVQSASVAPETPREQLDKEGTPQLPERRREGMVGSESMQSASAAAETPRDMLNRDGTPELPMKRPSTMSASESLQSASVAGYGAESHEELNRDGTPQLPVRHPESIATAESVQSASVAPETPREQLDKEGTPELPERRPEGMAGSESMQSASAAAETPRDMLNRDGTPELPMKRPDAMSAGESLQSASVAGYDAEAHEELNRDGTPQLPVRHPESIATAESVQSASVVPETPREQLDTEGTPELPERRPEGMAGSESMQSASAAAETPRDMLNRDGTPELPMKRPDAMSAGESLQSASVAGYDAEAHEELNRDGTPQLPVRHPESIATAESVQSASVVPETPREQLDTEGTPELPERRPEGMAGSESMQSASAAAETPRDMLNRDGTPELPMKRPDAMSAGESLQSASVAGYGAESHEELNRDGTPQLPVRHPESIATAESVQSASVVPETPREQLDKEGTPQLPERRREGMAGSESMQSMSVAPDTSLQGIERHGTPALPTAHLGPHADGESVQSVSVGRETSVHTLHTDGTPELPIKTGQLMDTDSIPSWSRGQSLAMAQLNAVGTPEMPHKKPPTLHTFESAPSLSTSSMGGSGATPLARDGTPQAAAQAMRHPSVAVSGLEPSEHGVSRTGTPAAGHSTVPPLGAEASFISAETIPHAEDQPLVVTPQAAHLTGELWPLVQAKYGPALREAFLKDVLSALGAKPEDVLNLATTTSPEGLDGKFQFFHPEAEGDAQDLNRKLAAHNFPETMALYRQVAAGRVPPLTDRSSFSSADGTGRSPTKPLVVTHHQLHLPGIRWAEVVGQRRPLVEQAFVADVYHALGTTPLDVTQLKLKTTPQGLVGEFNYCHPEDVSPAQIEKELQQHGFPATWAQYPKEGQLFNRHVGFVGDRWKEFFAANMHPFLDAFNADVEDATGSQPKLIKQIECDPSRGDAIVELDFAHANPDISDAEVNHLLQNAPFHRVWDMYHDFLIPKKPEAAMERTYHRVGFMGFDWRDVHSEVELQRLPEAFVSDLCDALHITPEQVRLAEYTQSGEIIIDFYLTHWDTQKEHEIDNVLAQHEFPRVWELYRRPKLLPLPSQAPSKHQGRRGGPPGPSRPLPRVADRPRRGSTDNAPVAPAAKKSKQPKEKVERASSPVDSLRKLSRSHRKSAGGGHPDTDGHHAPDSGSTRGDLSPRTDDSGDSHRPPRSSSAVDAHTRAPRGRSVNRASSPVTELAKRSGKMKDTNGPNGGRNDPNDSRHGPTGGKQKGHPKDEAPQAPRRGSTHRATSPIPEESSSRSSGEQPSKGKLGRLPKRQDQPPSAKSSASNPSSDRRTTDHSISPISSTPTDKSSQESQQSSLPSDRMTPPTHHDGDHRRSSPFSRSPVLPEPEVAPTVRSNDSPAYPPAQHQDTKQVSPMEELPSRGRQPSPSTSGLFNRGSGPVAPNTQTSDVFIPPQEHRYAEPSSLQSDPPSSSASHPQSTPHSEVPPQLEPQLPTASKQYDGFASDPFRRQDADSDASPTNPSALHDSNFRGSLPDSRGRTSAPPKQEPPALRSPDMVARDHRRPSLDAPADPKRRGSTASSASQKPPTSTKKRLSKKPSSSDKSPSRSNSLAKDPRPRKTSSKKKRGSRPSSESPVRAPSDPKRRGSTASNTPQKPPVPANRRPSKKPSASDKSPSRSNSLAKDPRPKKSSTGKAGSRPSSRSPSVPNRKSSTASTIPRKPPVPAARRPSKKPSTSDKSPSRSNSLAKDPRPKKTSTTAPRPGSQTPSDANRKSSTASSIPRKPPVPTNRRTSRKPRSSDKSPSRSNSLAKEPTPRKPSSRRGSRPNSKSASSSRNPSGSRERKQSVDGPRRHSIADSDKDKNPVPWNYQPLTDHGPKYATPERRPSKSHPTIPSLNASASNHKSPKDSTTKNPEHHTRGPRGDCSCHACQALSGVAQLPRHQSNGPAYTHHTSSFVSYVLNRDEDHANKSVSKSTTSSPARSRRASVSSSVHSSRGRSGSAHSMSSSRAGPSADATPRPVSFSLRGQFVGDREPPKPSTEEADDSNSVQ